MTLHVQILHKIWFDLIEVKPYKIQILFKVGA